ncbi:hypothetical protein F5883DRAFT_436950, partial [Diaporthe sp. PMI_573]
DYGPLRKFPAPVAIETKTAGGDIEEAKVQLGVWTAAWFKRMADLDRQSKSKGLRIKMKTSPRSLGVPLLLIEGHRWSLYVACENDADIIIYGPEEIRHTNTIAGLYKLVACLKATGNWIRTSFWPWLRQHTVPTPPVDFISSYN